MHQRNDSCSIPRENALLLRCQLRCLPEECKLPYKTLASPARAGWMILFWARKHSPFPHSNQLARTLLTHTDSLSLRSRGQELFGHSEQNFSFKASLFPEGPSTRSAYTCILPEERFSLGFPLRAHGPRAGSK